MQTEHVAPRPPAADSRARDRQFVWHTWTPSGVDRSALTLSHGEGYRVWDVDGNEYLDASGLNSTCGYRRPEVVDAIRKQLDRLHHVDVSVASHEPVGLLAERIAGLLGDDRWRTLFVNSGSEGLEAAVVIAGSYWRHVAGDRNRIVAFERGYHGSTVTSRTLSGLPPTSHPLRDPVSVTHVELPAEPAVLRRPESLAPLVAAFSDAIDADGGAPPMAVVVEPFLNVGGGVALPPGFLRELRELCDRAGTLLILDEVFTAYGRTGRMFGCDRDGVRPDVLVSSKGLASGYAGIAAVTVDRRVHDTFGRDPILGGLRYGHTTSGHPGACAGALATLDVIAKESLVARSERLGAAAVEQMAPLQRYPHVTDVRGEGLALVVEVGSIEAAQELMGRAQQNGLLVRAQRDAIMAVPPLTIDEAGIAALVERLERTVAQAAA